VYRGLHAAAATRERTINHWEAAMTSREAAEAVGTEGETREERRARLRKVVQTPSEKERAVRELMQMDSDDADEDRAVLQRRLDARVLAIKQAFGSLAVELERDVRNVGAAAEAYRAAWATMVARYLKLGLLRGEYDALVDGFQVQAAPLPSVAILATRKELAAAQEITARVGVPDTNRVVNVAELVGTEGHALLVRAKKIPA